MDDVLWYLRKVPPGTIATVLAVAVIWFLSGSPGRAEFVPNFVGLSVQDAQAKAAERAMALKVEVLPRGGRAGTVIGQHPKPRTARSLAEPVTIEVTKGARQVLLPKVKGKSVDAVRQALQQVGLQAGVVTYTRDDSVLPDRVITTNPPPGTAVDVGSTIEIIASAP